MTARPSAKRAGEQLAGASLGRVPASLPRVPRPGSHRHRRSSTARHRRGRPRPSPDPPRVPRPRRTSARAAAPSRRARWPASGAAERRRRRPSRRRRSGRTRPRARPPPRTPPSETAARSALRPPHRLVVAELERAAKREVPRRPGPGGGGRRGNHRRTLRFSRWWKRCASRAHCSCWRWVYRSTRRRRCWAIPSARPSTAPASAGLARPRPSFGEAAPKAFEERQRSRMSQVGAAVVVRREPATTSWRHTHTGPRCGQPGQAGAAGSQERRAPPSPRFAAVHNTAPTAVHSDGNEHCESNHRRSAVVQWPPPSLGWVIPRWPLRPRPAHADSSSRRPRPSGPLICSR